jgi:YjbE family integral membrane protein
MLATPEFLSALAAIVVIDLVLAGDNAIVIALAARSLPKSLQRRAVIWGTVGAVAVRSALTVAVLWLLEIPGLMGAGGVLLAWIAYRLLAGDDSGKDHGVAAATGFWGAMRTIVIADAVMGLDNVLAVAGAAHGSVLLVVAGLLISVPIVVWGSTLILHWIERFPALLYLGGAVLAWTAAKMLADEPLLQESLESRAGLKTVLYLAVMGAVLGFAWLRNRRTAAQENAGKEAMQ